MADGIDNNTLLQTLSLIKELLEDKKKALLSPTLNDDMFTDPRFIELFEQYFKPLIDSSKKVADKFSKQRITILDILGVNEKTQELKQRQVIREVDKIVDKLKSLSKNINTSSYDGVASVLGLTKTDRANNRRLVNSAIHTLARRINKSASILNDPDLMFKFIGLKGIRIPSTNISTTTNFKQPRGVVTKTTSENVSPVIIQEIKEIKKESIAEKEKEKRVPTNVRIVDIVKNAFRWPFTGAKKDDKGSGKESDREKYSLSLNSLARSSGITLLAAALIPMASKILLKGLTDTGPLKGFEKMAGLYPIKFAQYMIQRTFNLFKKIFFKSKVAEEAGEKTAAIAGKVVAKKIFGKNVLEFLVKRIKNLPIIGTLVSLGFAFERISKGDIFGGLVDVASGLVVDIPFVGIPLSIALDAFNAVEDYKSGGINKPGSGKSATWKQNINKWIEKILPNIPGISSIIDISKSLAAFSSGNIKEGLRFLTRATAGFSPIPLQWLVDKTLGASSLDQQPAPSTHVSPVAVRNILNAKAFKSKIEKIKDRILDGGKYEDLFPNEKAEYDKQSVLIKNADDYINTQAKMLSNTSASKNSPSSSNKQTPITSNTFERNAAEESNDGNSSIIQPQTSNPQFVAETFKNNQTETNDLLKQMNGHLEDLKEKSSERNEEIKNPLSVTNIASSAPTSNGQTPLMFAIESVRDTCYTNRERIRNMILDNRMYA